MVNSIVQTPTNNLDESIQFYTKLGFEYVQHEERHYFSDDKVVIEVDQDRFARPGLKLYQENWDDEIKKIKEWTSVIKTESGHMLSDSNGVMIYLINGKLNLKTSSEESSVLGNCAGFSIESIDLSTSFRTWSTLGFKIKMGSEEGSWLTAENSSGFGMSMMKVNSCPHLFFNPSLSYFNGSNNLNVIQKIRSLRIPITEEITVFNKEGIVDNIIVRDPGGLGFFIFSD